MESKTDSLNEMFLLREEFMNALVQHRGIYPKWPLNVSDKENQQILRDSVLRGVEEMFEALQELKNNKPHRKTEIPNFNREAFVEENVDAFNYFFTTLILVGVTPDELLKSYKSKHRVIMKRLEEGY